MVRFEAELIHETDMALLYEIHGTEYWFPKSQVFRHDDNSIIVSRWIAVQKGLVDQFDWDVEQMD